MLNADRTQQAFMTWANHANFPWPLILKGDFEQTAANGVIGRLLSTVRSVPHFLLVDKDGKMLANGNKKKVFRVAGLQLPRK